MREILIIEESGAGKRLDVFLNEQIADITRSQIKKSVEAFLFYCSNDINKVQNKYN